MANSLISHLFFHEKSEFWRLKTQILKNHSLYHKVEIFLQIYLLETIVIRKNKQSQMALFF